MPDAGPLPDLGAVLAACPGIHDYSREPIRSWRAFEAAADAVRGFMGISPSAYGEARSVMGPQAAAITIAALLERFERVRSPGGYLRALTAKAHARRFRVEPMLEALRNDALRQ